MPGAKSLIEKYKAKGTGSISLPAKAKAEVVAILTYNSTAHFRQRVGRAAVCKMLQDDFGITVSEMTLQRWCQRELGRGFSG